MNTPEQIKPHADQYHNLAWQDYTPDELASWVILLRKRASHRTDEAKASKDRYDADNYLAMLQQHPVTEVVVFGNKVAVATL